MHQTTLELLIHFLNKCGFLLDYILLDSVKYNYAWVKFLVTSFAASAASASAASASPASSC